MDEFLESIKRFMYSQIHNCSQQLVCGQCKANLKKPVRIRTCGHLFCEDCLDLDRGQCPGCNTYFQVREVVNIDQYQEILQTIDSLERDLAIGDTISSASAIATYHLFVTDPFKGHKYKLCFCDRKQKRNAKGETQMHVFCKKKDVNNVQKQIMLREDINVKDYAGWTPLHEAIESNCEEIVAMLIDKGAIVNVPGENYITPLHKAVMIGNVSVIEKLMASGADVHALDFRGRKPADLTKDRAILEVLDKTRPVESESIVYNVFIKKKAVVYCHSVSESYMEKVLEARNKLWIVKSEFKIQDRQLTHLIIKKTHKPSFKILLSMVAGLFIVPQEWVDSVIADQYSFPLADETRIVNDEIMNSGIRRAMFNKLLGRPKLFDGISFHIEGHKTNAQMGNLTITRDFLKLLIIVGGGKILRRAPTPRTVETLTYPYHTSSTLELQRCANFIIFDEANPPDLQYNMAELKHKPSSWLIRCVKAFNMEPEEEQDRT